jgi:MIP family channel proteins
MGNVNMRKYICEFIGTLLLVFFAAGAIIIDSQLANLGSIGSGIISGTIVTIIIYTFVNISGAHVNPALTITLAIIGKFNKKLILGYISAQMLGSASAGILLYVTLGNYAHMGANIPNTDIGVTHIKAFSIEILLSFILAWVICGVSYNKNSLSNFAGIIIGATIGIEVMLMGSYAGASMNPARAFGPYLLNGFLFEYYWIYLFGSIFGMILGGVIYLFTHKMFIK